MLDYNWLPIEQAPVTNEWVVISGGTYGSEGVCEFHNMQFKDIALASYEPTDKCWTDGTGCYYHPTHWMPAPEPVGERVYKVYAGDYEELGLCMRTTSLVKALLYVKSEIKSRKDPYENSPFRRSFGRSQWKHEVKWMWFNNYGEFLKIVESSNAN